MRAVPDRNLGALLVVLTSLALSCAGNVDSPLPSFPREPQPEQFVGLSYPSVAETELHPPTRPLWLIAVDGASWDLLTPLLAKGQLPNMAALMERGAHGTLLSEEPMISPALWATIATGMPRFIHGVLNFVEKRPGRWQGETAGPLHRRSPALWEHVGAAGGRSTVIGWFGSYPAEPIAGRYLSRGFSPASIEPQQVHPADLLATIAGWDAKRPELPNTSEFIARSMREDAGNVTALRRLPAAEQADLVVVYLSAIDVAQHVEWRHMDPDSDAFPDSGPTDPSRAERIADSYRFIDRQLGRLLERMPADANCLLISDHGAGPMGLEEAFHLQLEVLLQQVGLMNAEEPDAGSAWALSAPYRHDKRIWVNHDDTGELRRRLLAMRTDLDEPLFESVLDHGGQPGWTPEEAALTVRFSPQALVTQRFRDGEQEYDFAPVRMRHRDVSGSHRLEGIFVAAGPDIASGAIEQPLNLYNIAPTALYLLGLPQDRRMLRWAPDHGGVAESILAEATLTSRPPVMLPTYPGTERTRETIERSWRELDENPSRKQDMERLRSLGYIQ